ncbi:MAG: GldG family protein [Myxococcota bacterium]
MDIRRQLLVHAWIQLGLWIVLGLVANHLSSSLFFRADVTQDQRYTLSALSRDSVSRLERPLVVRVFYSDDLGPPYNNHKQALLEKLQELAAWSGGKMEVELARPDSDANDKDEANRYGLSPIPYRFRQGGKFEARDVYMAAVLLYGDRVIPVEPLASIETFEYELVKALRALTQREGERKVIGYSTGHGELDLRQFGEDNPMGQLVGDMAVTYDVRPVPLGTLDEIPPDVDLLLVAGPDRPVSPRAQYQIDQFLMAGKPVAFFLRSTRPDFKTMKVALVRHAMYGLIGHFGLQLNKDVVIDREHNEQFELPVLKNGRMRRAQVDYPLIPVSRNLARNHPVSAGIDAAILPFVASVDVPEELPPGVEATVIVRTEPESVKIEGLRFVNPEALQQTAPGELQGEWPTVVALTGRFGSYYADKKPPPPAGQDPNDPTWSQNLPPKIVDSTPTRLLVAGSADMLGNNSTLVLNTLDWLAEDTALLGIRTELATSSAFESPEGSTLQVWRAAIIGGPLGVLYLLGLGVLLVNRRRS